MNVSYEKVTANQAGELRSLAPEHIVQNIERPDFCTVLARFSDSDETAGVYQFQILEEKSFMTWLYVARSFRGCGLGKELLENLYKQPELQNLSMLQCRIYEGCALNFDISSFSEYLLSSGFDEAREIEGPFVIPGRDILPFCTDEKVRELEREASGAYGFSKGTPDYVVKAGKELGITDAKELLTADKEFSSICEKDGNPYGILAMKKTGLILTPAILVAKDKEAKEKLFAATFLNLLENIRLKEALMFENGEDINEWMKLHFPKIENKKAILLTKNT